MALVAEKLYTFGYDVVAQWVFGSEEGKDREAIALMDLNDVDRSDVVVSFTQPRGTLTPNGGRHVEFGYALAKGKDLVIIGERENVFHWHPNVKVYSSVDEWLKDD